MENNNSLSGATLVARLYSQLYLDIAAICGVPIVDTNRDMTHVMNRFASEGVSFLTKTLPRVGKALDKALQTHLLDAVPGLQLERGTKLPKLFGYLFKQIFEDTGELKAPTFSNIQAVRGLRQLMFYTYKLEMPYTDEDCARVVDSFLQTERDLQDLIIPEDSVTEYATRLIGAAFNGFCARNIIPSHGPGSVATGEKPWEKSRFKRIYKPLEAVYPFAEYMCYSMAHVADQFVHEEGFPVQELEVGTARVVLVPKDSRGPRLISCEPLEYQWIQQGLGRKIVSWLESSSLSRGHVNFTDQTTNRRLALEGSIDSKWVTLDMKEASDRVSISLVKRLFSHCNEGLQSALLAARTHQTELPDGTVVPLLKYAPMGSALCFPVEAVCFWALAVAAVMHEYKLPRAKARSAVYVYGDDIVCSREVYPAILQHLPRFGLLFNDGKCCTEGFFRESCGVDAYHGVEIQPLRLKRTIPTKHTADASVFVSMVSHFAEAKKRGYDRLAAAIKTAVEHRLGTLPTTYQSCGVLTWVDPDEALFVQPDPKNVLRTRFKKARHGEFVPQIWGWQPKVKRVTVPSDDWCTVLHEHSRKVNALEVTGEPGVYAVPHRIHLKRGWSDLSGAKPTSTAKYAADVRSYNTQVG